MTPETVKRLRDVRRTCAEIEQFMADVEEPAFLANRQLHQAILKLLEVVAEALNAAFRSDNVLIRTIPDFRNYINLRNQIRHSYDDVNYRIVWRVTVQEVPKLRMYVDGLLPD